MYKKWLVNVDLDGTTVKVVFVNQNGEIIYKWEVPTNKSQEGNHLSTDIAKEIDQTLDKLGQNKNRLISIGAGTPGLLTLKMVLLM
ncbi:hypothetical protein [Bacillus sp. OTU530]|uniref:hypothetical protein n=1 Tax=Bacillus sp. OTU530 TaxID=3043862 RepID=UPI00313B835E